MPGGVVSVPLGGVSWLVGGAAGSELGGVVLVPAGGVCVACDAGSVSIGAVVVGGITPGAELAGTGKLWVATGIDTGPVVGTTATATGGAGLPIGALTV